MIRIIEGQMSVFTCGLRYVMRLHRSIPVDQPGVGRVPRQERKMTRDWVVIHYFYAILFFLENGHCR